MEFLQHCFAPATMPFSVLMGFVLAYWALCILGGIGMDSLDIDLDAADLDVDFDVDVDVDVDIDADLDVDGVGSGGGTSIFVAMLKMMNVGEVPLMVVVSVLITSMWACSLVLNSSFNPASKFGLTMLLLIPNWIISLFATKLLTAPFRAVFKRANRGIAKPTKIIGRTCRITTQKVTTSFGQAELCHEEEDATQITLNVRSRSGEQLGKGDEVLVVEHDDESNTYFVVPL